MFAVAFEQARIVRHLVDCRISVVVFVFDSQFVKVPMDSRSLLEIELDTLVPNLCPRLWFVHGDVLDFLGVHSCEKVVVVVLSQYLEVSFRGLLAPRVAAQPFGRLALLDEGPYRLEGRGIIHELILQLGLNGQR